MLAAVALAGAISQQESASLPVQAYVVRPVDVEVQPIHEILNCCGDLDAIETVPDPYAFLLDGEFEVVRVVAGAGDAGDVIAEHFQASLDSGGVVDLAFIARRGRTALIFEIDQGVVCLMPDDIETFDLQSAFAKATTDEEGMRCIPAL